MGLFYDHLDGRTRALMLDEMEGDTAANRLHISPYLSGQGQRDYPNLLRTALQNGTDDSLAAALSQQRRLEHAAPRRSQSDGFSLAAVPSNAAQVLAESEFNRYYIRALARRAIEDGISELIVVRAKPVEHPRPESEALVETTIAPQAILDDLRAHSGEPPSLAVPAGPGSGLSVRLP
ncbi:MAG: hypothetical protein ABI847_12655 [Anaerolineales bacterium]